MKIDDVFYCFTSKAYSTDILNSQFSVKCDIFKSAAWVLWVNTNENLY